MTQQDDPGTECLRPVQFINGFTTAERKASLHLVAIGTSQKTYSNALAVLRTIGPENLKMAYDVETRKKFLSGAWDGEKKKMLKWNFNLRFNTAGESLTDDTKLDQLGDGIDQDMDTTHAKVWAAFAKFRTALGDGWYATYKKLMKGMALAICIETRKKEVMMKGAMQSVNGQKTRVGMVAPQISDLGTLHPLVSRSISAAMKGPGAVLTDYIRVDKNRQMDRRTKQRVTGQLLEALEKKIGKEMAHQVTNAESDEIAFRVLNKVPAAIMMKWDPLQFFDLPGLRAALQSGDSNEFMTGGAHAKTIVGINGQSREIAEVSVACTTGAIFMSTDINKLTHRASMVFTKGEAQADASSHKEATFVPHIAVKEMGGGTKTGVTGQQVGYNPNGANCSMAVMSAAQTYLSNVLTHNGQSSSGIAFGAQTVAKTALMTRTTVDGWVNGTWGKVEGKWEDFFLSVTPKERETLQKKREASDEPKPGPFKRSRRH